MRLTLHLASRRGLPGLRRAAAALPDAQVARDRPRHRRRGRGARRVVHHAAHQQGDPRQDRGARPVDADPARPHARAARPAPARRPLRRHAAATRCSSRTRARCPRRTRPPRPCSPATSTRSAPRRRRDIAAWAGAAQRDFDFDAIPTVSYRDEHGRTLIDLPGQRDPARRPRRSRRAFSPTGTSRCSPTRTATGSSRPRSSRSSSRSPATRRSPSTAASSPAGRWTKAA